MNLLRLIKSLSMAFVVIIFLTSCGNSTTPEPTTTPAPPTADPGQMTVGDVIALAGHEWDSVTTMRTTSQSGPIPREGEKPPFSGVVQDWTANGNRHLTEFQDGVAINEQIYVDGVVYMRGQFVSAAIAPGMDINTWVILDAQVVPDQSPVGIQIRNVTRQQTDPYGPLTDDLLARPVQAHGKATVGNRSCTLYVFGDENETGTEIQYEIAIADTGLPCQVIQRAGNFQNSIVYEFNIDITIEAPLDGTPVSGTPEG